MVMARPVASGAGDGATGESAKTEADSVTFVQDAALQALFPEGSHVDVVAVARLTDFFLGLNANRWLLIRMGQLAAEGERQMGEHANGSAPADDLETFLAGTGFAGVPGVVEPPPDDASYLFGHMGAGGNSGVSGQKIVSDTIPAKWGDIVDKAAKRRGGRDEGE